MPLSRDKDASVARGSEGAGVCLPCLRPSALWTLALAGGGEDCLMHQLRSGACSDSCTCLKEVRVSGDNLRKDSVFADAGRHSRETGGAQENCSQLVRA